jgi:acyl-CoA dehydrogenase
VAAIDLTTRTLLERAARAAAEAEAHADEVDRDARFPHEAIDALREEGLLGVLVPEALGGEGATVGAVAEVVELLGRRCATTAMVFAMHQIQVNCLVRHGRTPLLQDYQRRVVAEGLLLASATTEMGVGGDTRSSICAVEVAGGRFTLVKQAPVISYGEHADGILATARRTPDSPPNDQVLVVCRRGNVELERLTEWDTLGFRGTCSNGFELRAGDDEGWVLPVPYAEISSQTMLPTSHVVWASVWLGLATGAAEKARKFVQAEARKKPGTTPPAAVHLAELAARHQQFADLTHAAARRYDGAAGDVDVLEGMAFAIAMNGLKVSASELVVELVHRAMAIVGIAGYSNRSPWSLARELRDAHGAALMVNNDRLTANNAQMLLVHRGSLA